MSSYRELIKNFERIRSYMREFYVYGFKSREEYDAKSARTYDDERRRIESWLSEHTHFTRDAEGKRVFLSIDSRAVSHNPLFKAWKARSFTDGDITLHFILMDLLHSPEIALSVPELQKAMDEDYFSAFDTPMLPDESTIRGKLKEYCKEGILVAEKQGRRTLYRRTPDTALPDADLLDYFSEVAPGGVIGSFLLDKLPRRESAFAFKHHYITGALDSGILLTLFSAMHEKRTVTVTNHSPKSRTPSRLTLVPLRVLISVQSGRQHLIAYLPDAKDFRTLRLDFLSDVKLGDPAVRFDALRTEVSEMQKHMWGVNTRRGPRKDPRLEHVEFTVRVARGEEYIVRRLEREKRVGRVECIREEGDAAFYRFCADVYDASELVPWIRTFLGRIARLHFSNRTLEKRFVEDVRAMYASYGIGEEGTE